MMNNDLISIVVPVYNVELYIEKCIKTILNQTYENFELLLINDGSNDESGFLCDKYLKLDSRVRLYHKANGGLSSARNYGIKKSFGKYITFVDSDDYIERDYLETLYTTLKEKNVNIAVCPYSIIRGEKIINIGNGYKSELLSTAGSLSRMLLEQGFTVSAYAKLYRKSLFNDISYPEGKVYEDNATTYKLFLKCNEIAYNNKSIYNYCIRSNSITTKSFSIKNIDYITITDSACNEILKHYPSLEDECKYRKAFVRLTILKKMMGANIEDNLVHYQDEIIVYLKTRYDILLKNKFIDNKIRLPMILLRINLFLFKIGVKLYDIIR